LGRNKRGWHKRMESVLQGWRDEEGVRMAIRRARSREKEEGERTRQRKREDRARIEGKPVFSEWNIEQFSVA